MSLEACHDTQLAPVNIAHSCYPASRVQEEPPPKRSTGCICLQMRSSSSVSAILVEWMSPEQVIADQAPALQAQ